ncbi:hypothetical protein ACWGJT_22595 [Streptomyces xantholiticus]
MTKPFLWRVVEAGAVMPRHRPGHRAEPDAVPTERVCVDGLLAGRAGVTGGNTLTEPSWPAASEAGFC